MSMLLRFVAPRPARRRGVIALAVLIGCGALTMSRDGRGPGQAEPATLAGSAWAQGGPTARLYFPQVVRYEARAGRWQHFRPAQIRALALDAGQESLWAATSNGVLRWDLAAGLERYETVPLPAAGISEDVYDVLVDGTEQLWVAAVGGVARRDRAGRWQSWTAADGLPLDGTASESVVLSLGVGPAGRMLAGTREGLAEQGADGHWSVVDDPAIGSSWVLDIAVDTASGEIALATYSGAAIRAADGKWTRAGTDDVHAVTFDREGNAWFAGTKGVSARSRQDGTWRFVPLPTYLVWELAFDRDGALLCGIDGGLARLSPSGQVEPVALPPADRTKRVLALAVADDGRLWVGRSDGHLDARDSAGRWTTRRIGGVPLRPSDLAFDAAGGTWIGGEEGVARRAQDGSWAWYGRRAGLDGTSVASLLTDRSGVAWVGTGGNDGGMPPLARLYSIDPQGQVTDRTPPELVNHIAAAAQLGPDGSVWHAVDCRLLLVHRPDGQVQRLPMPNEGSYCHASGSADGAGRLWWAAPDLKVLLGLGPTGDWLSLFTGTDPPVQYVTDLDVDPSGQLWMTGKNGIARRDPSGRTSFQSYGDLGFPGTEIHEPVLGIGADGSATLVAGSYLHQMDPDGTWRQTSLNDLPFLANIRDIRYDRHGDVWFAGNEVSVLRR